MSTIPLNSSSSDDLPLSSGELLSNAAAFCHEFEYLHSPHVYSIQKTVFPSYQILQMRQQKLDRQIQQLGGGNASDIGNLWQSSIQHEKIEPKLLSELEQRAKSEGVHLPASSSPFASTDLVIFPDHVANIPANGIKESGFKELEKLYAIIVVGTKDYSDDVRDQVRSWIAKLLTRETGRNLIRYCITHQLIPKIILGNKFHFKTPNTITIKLDADHNIVMGPNGKETDVGHNWISFAHELIHYMHEHEKTRAANTNLKDPNYTNKEEELAIQGPGGENAMLGEVEACPRCSHKEGINFNQDLNTQIKCASDNGLYHGINFDTGQDLVEFEDVHRYRDNPTQGIKNPFWTEILRVHGLTKFEKTESIDAYFQRIHKFCNAFTIQMGLSLIEKKDLNRAETWFIKAHPLSPQHAWSLGEKFAEKGGSQDLAKAEAWFVKAAEGDPSLYAWKLGEKFAEGNGVIKNSAKAEEWFIKAAKGQPYSYAWKLGEKFAKIHSEIQDFTKAAEWFEKAAEKEPSRYAWKLGEMFSEGNGVIKDLVKAAAWYEKAAEKNPQHAWELGEKFAETSSEIQDLEKAEKWLTVGAKVNPSSYAWQLGLKFSNGYGVKKDPAKTKDWLTQGAKLNPSRYAWKLGEKFAKGKGVAQDSVEAGRWLTIGAELNPSQYAWDLGERLWNGDGVKQDRMKAEEWLVKIAKRSTPHAWNLGEKFWEAKDRKKAEFWLIKAASHSYRYAWELGEKLGDGGGLAPDLAEAESWLTEAAKLNPALYARKLAEKFSNGNGVNPDSAKAEEWFGVARKTDPSYAKQLQEKLHQEDGVIQDLAKDNLQLLQEEEIPQPLEPAKYSLLTQTVGLVKKGSLFLINKLTSPVFSLIKKWKPA